MASTSGFTLGIIGGLLDFASAASLLVSRSSQPAGMMGGSSPSVWWIAVLLVLGTAVIVSAVLSITMLGVRLARAFSLLMVAYGVAMVASGWIMSTGGVMGGDALFYGYAMIIVGALMLVDGAMMVKGSTKM